MSMLAPRADVGMRAPTARFGGSTARGGAETFRGDGSETARGGRNPFAAGASPDSHRGGRADVAHAAERWAAHVARRA